MELIGAVALFLLGSCVGLLVALYLQGARRNQFDEAAAEQRAAALALAEQQHNEQRVQWITMTAALVERIQLVGAALAAEVRDANTQQRNDLRLAVGLPRASVPGQVVTPRAPPPRTPRVSSSPPTPRSGTLPALSRTGDEPTPPSGWTIEQVRAHTETAGEEQQPR